MIRRWVIWFPIMMWSAGFVWAGDQVLSLPDQILTARFPRIYDRITKPETSPQIEVSLAGIKSPTDRSGEQMMGEKVDIKELKARSSCCINPLSVPLARGLKAESVEYQLALYYIRKRDLERAEEALDRLLTDHPQGVRTRKAYFWLGDVLYRRGKPEKARESFAKMVEITPPGISDDYLLYGLYSLGSLALITGQPDLAYKSLSQVSSLVPPGEFAREASYRRGLAAWASGRYSEALQDFGGILSGPPSVDQEGALFWLAESYYALGSYPDAAVRYRQYLERYPKGVKGTEARMGLAWSYWNMKEWSAAATAFDLVTKTDLSYDHLDSAAFYQARALELADNIPQAIESYQRFASIFRDSPFADDALFSLGVIYHDRDPDESFHQLVRLLAIYPDTPHRAEAEYLMGMVEVGREQFIRSQRRFQEALEHSPQKDLELVARFRIGWIDILLDRWTDARETLKAIAEENPDLSWRSEVVYWWAEASLSEGRFDEATMLFREVVDKAGPRQADAWFGLGRVAVLSRDWTTAESAFRKAGTLGRGATPADAYYNLGLTLMNQKRFLEAEEAFARAGQLAPDQGQRERAEFYRIRSRSERGDSPEVLASALVYLNNYPDGKWVHETLMLSGWANFRLERYQQALADFRRVAIETLDFDLSFEARLKVADSLYNLDKSEEAREEYRAIARENPEGRWGREASLALVYLAQKQDDPRAFQEEIDRFLVAYPDDSVIPSLLLEAAREVIRRGDFETALRRGREVIERAPGSSYSGEAKMVRASVYLKKGYPAAAFEELKGVSEKLIGDRWPDLLFLRAEAKTATACRSADLGLPAEADEIFRSAIDDFRTLATIADDDPRFPGALVMETELAFYFKAWQEAKVALEELLNIYINTPKQWDIYLQLAQAETNLGHVERAENLYRRMIENGDSRAVSLAANGLGVLLNNSGRKKEAAMELVVGYLRSKEGPLAAENLWQAAEIHRGLGNREEERRLLKLLIDSGLPSPLVKKAADQLKK